MLSTVKTEEKNNNIKSEKIIYIEYLRVIACIAVIILHVSGDKITSANGMYWNIMNIFNSLSRWSVPIFFMITGVTFLRKDKEISIKKLYKKYISKMIIIYIFWSTLYALFLNIGKNMSIKVIIEDIIKGHYHLWFIYAIIGIYMIVPLLKKIAEDKKICQYFLVLWLIIGSFIYTLGKVPQLANIYSVIQEKINLYFVLGYSGYSILGLYIHNNEISKKNERIIYALGIFGAIITILGTALEDGKTLILYHNLSPNIILMSLAIFTLFKQKVKQLNKYILNISKLTLGIYLIHPMIFQILKYLGINTMILNPIVMIPIIVIMVLVISSIMTTILKKIKGLNYLI